MWQRCTARAAAQCETRRPWPDSAAPVKFGGRGKERDSMDRGSIRHGLTPLTLGGVSPTPPPPPSPKRHQTLCETRRPWPDSAASVRVGGRVGVEIVWIGVV